MVTLHEDVVLFRESIQYTAATTGFSARLIEKDYYCSVLLEALSPLKEVPLVFKGGTCLAKVHAGFYRLSEDMDFLVPVEVKAKRSLKREIMEPVKIALKRIPENNACIEIIAALEGANQSSQYLGTFGYRSVLRDAIETIKIEISLREPLHEGVVESAAHTLLLDPISDTEAVPPFRTPCISLTEAYAEKLRAALTRREVAIRDFFDIDYMVRKDGLNLEDQRFLDLVRFKLQIPGNLPIDLSAERMQGLKGQLETRLRPVLRELDYKDFDIQLAIHHVRKVADRLPV